MRKKSLFLALLCLFLGTANAFNYTALISQGISAMSSEREASMPIPADAQIQVGFSPNGQALPLVLKTIRSASKTLDMLTYSFTSSEVTRELLAARKRGVQLRMVVDDKSSRNAKSMSALSALSTAGAQIRLNATFAIHHDKVVIADGRHVQTGSFNYSQAADKSNSENVIVLWNAPSVAKAYLGHFQTNWETAHAFSGR